MDKTRKNTLKIVFGQGAKVPMYMDVLRFAGKTLKLPQNEVHSIYKDENEHQFYIKFMDEASFNWFTRRMEEQYIFDYVDCSTTIVHLEVASSLFRYVRIFNLPPEIDDKEIAMALEKFGVIRQHVREKYPADSGFAVFSGIRGVHMEISKELPANLFIGHCKARLYYEGLKNKCFYCKSESHLKVDCPKLASVKAAQNGGQSSGSYSQVLANAAIGASASPPSGLLNMTSFPSIGAANQSSETAAAKNKQSNTSPETAPEKPRASGATTEGDGALAATDTGEVQEDAKGDPAKRPKQSSSDDGSGDDKPPKKQQFVKPSSPIDAVDRRSRTMDRKGSASRSPTASRSRSRNAR